MMEWRNIKVIEMEKRSGYRGGRKESVGGLGERNKNEKRDR
jgi:hypothetical protein